MRIDRFSYITCSILLLASMVFPIHATAQNDGSQSPDASSPQCSPSSYGEGGEKTVGQDDPKQLNKEPNPKNTQQSEENGNSPLLQDVLTKDHFDKEIQLLKEPDMTCMVLTIICVGGVIFLLLIISTLILLYVIKRSNGKTLRKEEIRKLLSESFSSFSREYQKSVRQILEKLPSEVAISSSVQEKLQGRFEELRKALCNPAGAKSETEILAIVNVSFARNYSTMSSAPVHRQTPCGVPLAGVSLGLAA